MNWIKRWLQSRRTKKSAFEATLRAWEEPDISIEEAKAQAEWILRSSFSHIECTESPVTDDSAFNLLPPFVSEVFRVYDEIAFGGEFRVLKRPTSENVFQYGERIFVGIGVADSGSDSLCVEANLETIYEIFDGQLETDAPPEVVEDVLENLSNSKKSSQYTNIYQWIIVIHRVLLADD